MSRHVLRSSASLEDTPSGKPRRRWSRRAKLIGVGLLVALMARTVQGFLPPSLSPEQVAALDADTRYARWQTSPEGVGFERLRQAAASTRRDNNAIGECLATLQARNPVAPAKTHSAEASASLLLRHYAPQLRVMHDSLEEPFACPPWRSVNEFVPYFADFRTLARLNCLSAEMKQRAGDKDGAAEDLAVGMQFGARIMNGGNIIGRLVGIACQSIAERPLWKTLPSVSAAEYQRLLPRLQQASQLPPFSATLTEEEQLGQRMLLQLWGDKRVGAGKMDVSPLYQVTNLVWPRRVVWAGYTGYIEEWKQIASEPYQLGKKPALPSDLLSRILLPVYDGMRFKDVDQETQNAFVLQAASVYQFRAEHGHFPTHLADLPSAPVADPFGGGKALGYRLTADGFVLYSVGPDGHDDGGQAIKNDVAMGSPTSRTLAERMTRADSIGDVVAGVNY